MRTLSLNNGHTCELYHSIMELPESRRVEMNCYLMQHSGIGSDLGSAEAHIERVGGFLAAGQPSEAADELALLLYNIRFALERFSPESLAFGCLVARVDGQPVTDLSEEGLSALRDQLSGYGLTAGLVSEEIAGVKKNFTPS